MVVKISVSLLSQTRDVLGRSCGDLGMQVAGSAMDGNQKEEEAVDVDS